jgi:hypothetical protein
MHVPAFKEVRAGFPKDPNAADRIKPFPHALTSIVETTLAAHTLTQVVALFFYFFN